MISLSGLFLLPPGNFPHACGSVLPESAQPFAREDSNPVFIAVTGMYGMVCFIVMIYNLLLNFLVSTVVCVLMPRIVAFVLARKVANLQLAKIPLKSITKTLLF